MRGEGRGEIPGPRAARWNKKKKNEMWKLRKSLFIKRILNMICTQVEMMLPGNDFVLNVESDA